MKSFPDKNSIKKLGAGARILAGFIVFCCILAGVGLIDHIFIRSFDFENLYTLFLIGGLSHVSLSILFTGYAPKYLWFAHARKEGHSNDKT